MQTYRYFGYILNMFPKLYNITFIYLFKQQQPFFSFCPKGFDPSGSRFSYFFVLATNNNKKLLHDRKFIFSKCNVTLLFN